jgi:glycosyltransferase involved in cell wall biosynthesis
MLFFYNSILVTIFWVLLSAYLLINSYRIKFLRTLKTSEILTEPAIAIIIAVRNEEEELEKALNSVCNLNYSNYRLVLVNDRSTDRTPQILESFAQRFSYVTVIHINKLPDGWLGKSHALYQGYLNSREEWLLFTDGDVSFKPDTLTKAISYSITQQLDHLVLLPHIHSRSALFNSVLATFKIMFDLQYRPWAAKNPHSGASIGMGAFNLVRRTAYETAGTHLRFALHPNDDLQLGEHIKSSGHKQDVLYGDEQIQYEWYNSLNAFINGLMKNAFSSVNYSFLKAVINSIAALLFFVLPVPVLLVSGVPQQQYLAAIILISQLALYLLKPALHARWWYVLIIPFAAAVISFIMLKSAILTTLQRGIYWRENFYPLSQLKKYK